MATGAFFNALNYRLWVKLGTTASTAPTASTGMTEVLSLTNSSIQSKSDVTKIIDYGSPQGYKASLVTGAEYDIPMELNLNLKDPAYAILKEASMEAASGVTVEWYRESPVMTAMDIPEKHAGVAFVTDFTESVKAGNVATISFSLSGYGGFTWTAETD